MVTSKIIIVFAIITTIATNSVNGGDKYTDENRPYEFGFSIDGEQHRHEKKDKNGIIMGEFGFITADGVYHVTVYATDENGRFKILSMKNIRVKPYPGASVQNSRTGHSLDLPNSPKTSSNPQVETNVAPDKPAPQLRTSLTPSLDQPSNAPQSRKASLQIEQQPAAPVQSCSHCSLPATSTIAPRINTNSIQQTSSNSQANQPGKIFNNAYGEQDDHFINRPIQNYQPGQAPQTEFMNTNLGNTQVIPGITNLGTNKGEGDNPQSYPDLQNNDNYYQTNARGMVYENAPNDNKSQQNIASNYNNNNIQGSQGSNILLNNPPQFEYNSQTQGSNVPNREIDLPFDNQYQNNPQTSSYSQGANVPLSQLTPAERNAKSYEPTLRTGQQNTVGGINLNEYDVSNIDPPKTPKLLSAQMQIVDKDTDIYHKNPGERNGLPEGVTKDYMMRVLYVFNYTVGFHGHYEKGFADGLKQGYYYVTGRNGIRTRVDYEADEKGFRPKITNEVLDLLSDEVPKPETEKEPQYGLKSYEFKWLYFPVESKQRR